MNFKSFAAMDKKNGDVDDVTDSIASDIASELAKEVALVNKIIYNCLFIYDYVNKINLFSE